MKKSLSLILLSLAVLPPTSSAAILASYNFNTQDNTPASSDPNLTAGNFTMSGGITNAGNPVIYTPGWVATPTAYVDGTGATPGTEATAVTANDHHSFTLTPTAGYSLNLTSLTFATAFHTSSGGAVTLSGSFFVRSSLDNYATTISDIFTESHVVSATPAFTGRSVDLSGAAFQNITTPVTFRVYLFDNSNAATRYLSIDDVVLNGTVVPVPEPSAMAMASVCIAGMMFRRRPV